MTGDAALEPAHPGQSRRLPDWAIGLILLAVVAGVVAMALFLPDRNRVSNGQEAAVAGASLPTSTPADQAMDGDRLAEMMAYIEAEGLAVDSLIISRHGFVVHESHARSYFRDGTHAMHSVTKSVTSLLVGIALDQGLIRGLDTPVGELLPGYDMANLDERKARLTLEHLLTMTDGLDWPEHAYPYEDDRNIVAQMWRSPDAIQFILDRPMAHEPGEVWAYNSGASMLLGAIVEEASGRDLVEYAREVLFEPIGAGRIHWQKTPSDHYQTGGGLSLRPRDMAHLGQLMLQEGRWDGRQVLPAEWIARSTQSHAEADWSYGYGYQWWILPGGQGYAAQGLYGQRIFVVPEADLVVAITADMKSDDSRLNGLLQSFILPACVDLQLDIPQETYDTYGFKLSYPAGYYVQEFPVPGRLDVSERSGIVQLTANTEPPEIISVLWDAGLEPGMQAEALLQTYFARAATAGTPVQPGELGQTERDGQPLSYQFSQLGEGEASLAAVTGVWVCREADRLFVVTYASLAAADSSTLLQTLEGYLDRLTCP